MKGTTMKPFLRVLCVSCLLAVPLPAAFAEPPPTTARATLYDVKADGTQQIKEALAAAQKEKKHVLLQFGANWCGWCHKLHALFESDAAIRKELRQSYIVVLIDVDKNHNADVVARYGNPTRHGLPVIVILDAEGKMLTTQDTGKLEVGPKHDPQKVLAFLSAWTPKR
jgi:thiol:disulfide interchange protein